LNCVKSYDKLFKSMFQERAVSNFMLSSNNALSVLLYGIDLM